MASVYPTLDEAAEKETMTHRSQKWTTLPLKEPLRILIIGLAGEGKSSVGNLLVGRNVFTVSEGAVSKTSKISDATSFTFGRHFTVIDTPPIDNAIQTTVSEGSTGQYDSMDTTPKEVPNCNQEIRQIIKSGTDVVILVMSESGSQGRDRGIDQLYKSGVLGDIPKNRLMVVVTHAKNYSENSVADLLNAWTKESALHKFMHGIGYRVALVELEKQTTEPETTTGPDYARHMVMSMVNKVLYDNIKVEELKSNVLSSLWNYCGWYFLEG